MEPLLDLVIERLGSAWAADQELEPADEERPWSPL
jgi:hypothetical protein